MVHVLARVGWKAHQMEGGYRAFRRAVLEALATQPGRFRYRVLCGATGCGKSRLLDQLRLAGAQVLDLEALAEGRPQPKPSLRWRCDVTMPTKEALAQAKRDLAEYAYHVGINEWRPLAECWGTKESGRPSTDKPNVADAGPAGAE